MCRMAGTIPTAATTMTTNIIMMTMVTRPVRSATAKREAGWLNDRPACAHPAGLDDGPKDMSESLEMCRQAMDDGVTTIVATPI